MVLKGNPRGPSSQIGCVHYSPGLASGANPEFAVQRATLPNTHGFVNHAVNADDRNGVNTQTNAVLPAPARIPQLPATGDA